MKYEVISASSTWGSNFATSALEKKVKEHTKDGWIPQGGISIVVENGETIARQAMMKPD